LGHKLLLIDDDLLFADMLKTMLELRGYRVVIALDGWEGLRKINDVGPELVIVDVMMPAMDGWEVCQRLREFSDVPIVILTACATPQNAAKAATMGADGFVTKPVTIDELDLRIGSILRRRNGCQSATKSPTRSDRRAADGLMPHVAQLGSQEVFLTPTELIFFSSLATSHGWCKPVSDGPYQLRHSQDNSRK
jgi:DNA-binding response OmpR family regulator